LEKLSGDRIRGDAAKKESWSIIWKKGEQEKNHWAPNVFTTRQAREGRKVRASESVSKKGPWDGK